MFRRLVPVVSVFVVVFVALLTAGSSTASGWAMQQTQPAEAPSTTAEFAPSATSPAPAAAPVDPKVEKLVAEVTQVSGKLVKVRAGENEPWQPVTVGMKVTENYEFYTGPRSMVQFVIAPDHKITLDRQSTIKVLQAVLDNGVVKTQMGMKQGRALYEIEAAGREHESSIATPSSTLAVRGTRFIAYDQRPFPAKGISLQGRVAFRDFKKRTTVGSRTGGKSVVDVNANSAASYARGQTIVDPGIRLARSEGELPLVANLLSTGATVEFDYDKGIRVVRGGQVPQSDNELIPTLPGSFNFVLRWQGNTDLNIGVVNINPADNPPTQSLYPVGGVNLSPNGGEIPFDHRGGPNGGIEVAFWNDPVPLGAFRFGSVHISGPNAPATFDVFRDGQRLDIDLINGGTAQTAAYEAGPINPEFGAGQAVGSVRISPTGGKVSSSRAAKLTSVPKAAPAPKAMPVAKLPKRR